MRYLLEWTEEDLEEAEGSGYTTTDQEFCHPLCQCPKCAPAQKVRPAGHLGDAAGGRGREGGLSVILSGMSWVAHPHPDHVAAKRHLRGPQQGYLISHDQGGSNLEGNCVAHG